MYWSDSQTSKIFQASMDGTDIVTLQTDNLTWPNALALDVPAKKLYWMDVTTKRVEQFDLQKSSRKVSD